MDHAGGVSIYIYIYMHGVCVHGDCSQRGYPKRDLQNGTPKFEKLPDRSFNIISLSVKADMVRVWSKRRKLPLRHMSHSLNSSKGAYMGDKGDA